MKVKQFCLFKTVWIFLFFAVCIFSSDANALERWLVPDTSQCAADTSINPCHTTLQDAVTLAVDGSDSIRILPGTYPANNVILTKNVSIFGEETARTFLNGNGSGTILTISSVTTSMTVRNITFINAATGIQLNNSPSVTINNNIFAVGASSTAVQTTASSSSIVINNTFYNNFTGISSDLTSLNIKNNIFSQNSNGTAIIPSTMLLTGIKNNLFFGGTIGPPVLTVTSSPISSDPNFSKPDWKGNISNLTPSFVHPDDNDITKRDFHLQEGSPCINNGDTSDGLNKVGDTTKTDIGAYGGSKSDTIPFPVQNLVSSKSTPDSTTVHLTWDTNLCYLVTGYTIHYGTESSSLTATQNPGTLTAFDVPGLTPASEPTGTAVLTNTIASNTLLLSWPTGSVNGATGYEVRYEKDGPPTDNTCPYSTIPTPGSPTIDVNNTTSYPLTGLDNNTCYSVIVVPYALATYYFAVTAHYLDPNVESTDSNIEKQEIGSKAYDSAAPNVIHDFPEPVTPNPNLLNKGCFIATAAYGHYSAPQVQALREFRDRYLMTNAPGRAFVQWYYQHGPVGAQFINNHPWLKPFVRTALMPAVGGAMFMTRTSIITKTIVFMFIGLLAIIRLRPLQKKDIHHENI